MSIKVELPDTVENMLRNCTDALAIMACNEHADIADFRECFSTPLFDLYQILVGADVPKNRTSHLSK